MKRDARIGLAVVLVLGLAVTLLVGRAIFKRDAELAADKAPDASAPYSHETSRAESSDPATAASRGVSPDPTRTQNADSALNAFREDQTRALLPAFPARTPEPAPRETAGTPNRPAPAPYTPIPLHEDMLDHEHALPVTSSGTAPATADSFGYTVAGGDNIWKISSKVYGDGKFTQKIVEANKGLNVSKMKPGMVIRIPTIANKTMLTKLPSYDEAVKLAAAPKAAKPAEHLPVAASTSVTNEKKEKSEKSVPTEATTHKVESGETLSSIATKHYGMSGPKTIASILSANPGLNPAKLKVGQELAIPAKK